MQDEVFGTAESPNMLIRIPKSVDLSNATLTAISTRFQG
jgi:hypothetical protein